MNGKVDTERILDAFLAPEADQLPDRVIDAALADIARTPQRRALRVPWRFPYMPALNRVTGIVAVALVAIVGAGGLIYLNSNSASGPGGPTTVAPTPTPSALPSGTAGWMQYTSEVHGFDVGYPEDWTVTTATRDWQAGDEFPADELPYADIFVSPGQGDEQMALLAWEMPAGEGRGDLLESVPDLTAWAEAFCTEVGVSSCEGFAQQAEPMCFNAGGDSCRAAILVPTAGAQYAFFVDWESAMFTNPAWPVRVVVVAREDDFPPAARYGGSVELLKSILTTMNVYQPGQQPPG